MMKRTEYEEKEHELIMYIADKFRDIQMQANALKNVEDEVKVRQTLVKISDFVEEIYKGYSSLEDLHHEDVDDSVDNEDDYDAFALF